MPRAAAGSGAAVEPDARGAQQGGVRAAAERAAAARSAVQGRERAQAVKLGEYFGRKPVVLAFVYYECPMLCTQVLNGLESALRVIDETVGKEFDVVTVSFDPKETPVLAAGKKKAYLERYKRPSAEQGWHFLTGEQASIAALTQGGGLQLLVGRGDAAVRARQRHRGGDAGRQAVALFLRHRLLAARREVRADRIVEREDRLAGGAAVALLLSLRSGDRAITGSWRCGRCGSAAR